MHSYYKMADAGIGTLSSGLRGRRFPIRLILSYIFDWLVCFVFVGIGGYLDRVAPAKRPFSLVDPNISYVTGNSFYFTLFSYLMLTIDSSIATLSPTLNSSRPTSSSSSLLASLSSSSPSSL